MNEVIFTIDQPFEYSIGQILNVSGYGMAEVVWCREGKICLRPWPAPPLIAKPVRAPAIQPWNPGKYRRLPRKRPRR